MKTKASGFTLIELAIVLVIITILIGGLAVPLSAQIQARRIAETNKILDEAREALIGYALANRASTCTCNYDFNSLSDPITALPSSTCVINLCPALTKNNATGQTTITIDGPRPYLPCPDNDGDGYEDRGGPSGSCSSSIGYFPWVTLGTAQQDAWGNRLLYAATNDLSRQSSGLSKNTPGDIQICMYSGNESDTDCGLPDNPHGDKPDVAQNVAVVILSHGPNGRGALNVSGKILAAPTDNSERENAKIDGSGNRKMPADMDMEFTSRPKKDADEFDDLVTWISADQLRGRICPPGGCP